MRKVRLNDEAFALLQGFGKLSAQRLDDDFLASGIISWFVSYWMCLQDDGDFEGMQDLVDGLSGSLSAVSEHGHPGSPIPGRPVDILMRVHRFPASRMPGEASN